MWLCTKFPFNNVPLESKQFWCSPSLFNIVFLLVFVCNSIFNAYKALVGEPSHAQILYPQTWHLLQFNICFNGQKLAIGTFQQIPIYYYNLHDLDESKWLVYKSIYRHLGMHVCFEINKCLKITMMLLAAAWCMCSWKAAGFELTE